MNSEIQKLGPWDVLDEKASNCFLEKKVKVIMASGISG